MPDLLVEVGCEELPASFVRKAFEDLKDSLVKLLEAEGLSVAESVAMGTPRRLIINLTGLPERQEDRTVEQRGPALKAAYDADGHPTPALQGFCRSQGATVEQLRKDEQYVWLTKTIPGQPTLELLATLIPKAIRSLTFEKSMRWGSSKMRFARPIRWLLASFGGRLVEFEIEGVHSGLSSRGHRFYKPESFEVGTFELFLKGLRDCFVEPDRTARRQRIEQETIAIANGEPVIPEYLLDENVFLTEWPTAVLGSFDPSFLELPESVLVTAMAKHERFFPIRESGKLANRFVSIRNAGEDDTVRKGNEWVLNARFNDAKFFYDEDRRHTLQDFLEKTSGILFQDRLGTVRQRADRLSRLASAVARATGASDEEVAHAARAGLLCKADLSTGLVGELASLQGTIGGEYAKREGEPEPVWQAIGAHYELSKCEALDGASRRTAIRLFIADSLDKLAGFFGIGMEPSGSSDPYALRRAATSLIEADWAWEGPMPSYAGLFKEASAGYSEQSVELALSIEKLAELFTSRYDALLPDERHDLLAAASLVDEPAEAFRPQGVVCRLRALDKLCQEPSFVHMATRPANILAAAAKKGIAIPEQLPAAEALDSAEGAALLAVIEGAKEEAEAASTSNDAEGLVRALLPLAAPVNAFFDSTMVMADDPKIRDARLALLNEANRLLRLAGDFKKIVVEG